MRQTLIYELDYFEKGKFKKTSFEIRFVPNILQKQLADLNNAVRSTQEKFERLKSIEIEIKQLMLIGYLENQKKIDTLNEELTEIEKDFDKIRLAEIPLKRCEIVCEILKINNCDNEKYTNLDFWLYCVDPTGINDFWLAIYTKDIDKKKEQ